MIQKILDEALFKINERGNRAEIQAVNNKIKALEDKEFKILYSNYTRAMIDNAKLGKKQNISNEKSCYEKRLKEIGISSINPDYSCKKCNDSGYIEGKWCDCLKAEVNKILIRKSGFDNLIDFKQIDYNYYNDSSYMQKVHSTMQKWCHSNFDKTLIFLSGGTGTGKTVLLKCMANELINLNHVVVLTTAFAMNQDFLKSYASRDIEEKNALLEKYLDSEVLFIDDLGTELKEKNITVNFLYQILNERRVKKLPTVITSNLDLKDLRDYYDERISSRIIDKTTSICLFIEGKDLRLKQK